LQDWENRQRDTRTEDGENSRYTQKLENFGHNHRSRTDNYRGRNENYSREDSFQDNSEHHKNYRNDQNKIRNDHRAWDENYRGGNTYNKGRRGRGGSSVFVNSNLKQTSRGIE